MTRHGALWQGSVRAVAALTVAVVPALGLLLALTAWATARALDPHTATIADVVVVVAAAVGACAAGALTTSAVALAVAPRRSLARRLAVSATPAAWRRIVTIALSGAAAAGLALPATAASGPADPPDGHESVTNAGWVAAPEVGDRPAGWLDAGPSHVDSPSPARAAGHQDGAPTPTAPPETIPAPERDRGPADARSASSPSPATAHATHTVERGESLWSITSDELDGTDAEVARAWPELYTLNRNAVGDDPSLIHPGAELVLPAGWQR